jgi:hypothetical protein
MRVMNGGLTEVGFVDPHDPTGIMLRPRIAAICYSELMLLQLYMHPNPRILFLSESFLTPIAPRAQPPPLY